MLSVASRPSKTVLHTASQPLYSSRPIFPVVVRCRVLYREAIYRRIIGVMWPRSDQSFQGIHLVFCSRDFHLDLRSIKVIYASSYPTVTPTRRQLLAAGLLGVSSFSGCLSWITPRKDSPAEIAEHEFRPYVDTWKPREVVNEEQSSHQGIALTFDESELHLVVRGARIGGVRECEELHLGPFATTEDTLTVNILLRTVAEGQECPDAARLHTYELHLVFNSVAEIPRAIRVRHGTDYSETVELGTN